jgi:hypothetical protein
MAAMSGEFAREVKFLVDDLSVAALHDWMRAHLEPDLNGAGPSGDRYDVSSLYFETEGFDVFHRHASYGRSKFRIRRYGDSSTTFLERKFRTPGLLAKRRTAIPLNDLGRLDAERADPAWIGWWFHRRVIVRRLRPLVQISYARTARVGATTDGPIRMTIDRGISATAVSGQRFQTPRGLPLLEGQSIVELKFQTMVPPPFKDVIARFGLEPQVMSKYRTGVAALQLAPAGAPLERCHYRQ